MMSAPADTPGAGTYDGEVSLATAGSRYETTWRNRRMRWSEFTAKLAAPVVTPETQAEYLALPKSEQDRLKDVGGYVGGTLKGGRRSAQTVAWRDFATLDADHATLDFPDRVEIALTCGWVLHSTRKHRLEAPRYRLAVRLSRPVTPVEYAAISRWLAGEIGIELFDDTTYEPHRLMYWPSHSTGAAWVFREQHGAALDVDEVLASFGPDNAWRDTSLWPLADRARALVDRERRRAGVPGEKPGWIGAFCRAYDIETAIEAFLPGVYVRGSGPGRWTYADGSTANGAVVYDGVFLYSHHATDPCAGQLVNAFDLVRLHRFGASDASAKEGTPVNRLPSYDEMVGLARADSAVIREMGGAAFRSATADFADFLGESAPEDDDWLQQLEYDRAGRLLPSLGNLRLVLLHRAELAGAIAHNEFAARVVAVRDLPWRAVPPAERGRGSAWRDEDAVELRAWLERSPGLNLKVPRALADDAVLLAKDAHPFHPVRDYLSALAWDGVPRVETILQRFLGAPDTPLVRAIARKFLAAAVARVFEPGCKWDYMPVLVGSQGRGKSTFVSILARGWGSDTFVAVHGKEAYEQLEGYWIVEVPELAAFKRAEVEGIKHFITKRTDSYRKAYARYVTDARRQCVLIGTTNNRESLVDAGGNRRFWMVDCAGGSEPLSRLEAEIDQIWAEAVVLYRQGEKLWMDTPELDQAATAEAEAHRSLSGLEALIGQWLETPVPADWYDRPLEQRTRQSNGSAAQTFNPDPTETIQRDRACALEVYLECLGGLPDRMTNGKAREINDILRRLPGWAPESTIRFGPAYGRTRGFRRQDRLVSKRPNDDDDIPF